MNKVIKCVPLSEDYQDENKSKNVIIKEDDLPEFVATPLYRYCKCGQIYNANANTQSDDYLTMCNECSKKVTA